MFSSFSPSHIFYSINNVGYSDFTQIGLEFSLKISIIGISESTKGGCRYCIVYEDCLYFRDQL